MNPKNVRRSAGRILAAGVAMAAISTGTVRAANNTCWTYNPGHIYYVAYQNNPPGPEYIVDLGDRSLFLNATDTITPATMNISASDFSSIFSVAAPFLKVGLFGDQNPPTRDAMLCANGPKDDSQLNGSSIIGADSQIESWATGIQATSNQIGTPICSPNAATYPGSVSGSYQFTLNSIAQGSLSGNIVWNEETRLSDANGLRTQTNQIRFNSSRNNPGLGIATRAPLGYFIVFTDGTAQFWPDSDGDGLPNVPIGSDPNADKCPTVNSTNNTDADGDNHAVPCDCNDSDPTVWSVPGEVPGLSWSNKTTLNWGVPSDPGGTAALQYDVLRGTQASLGGVPSYSCFSSNQTGTSANDASSPSGSFPWFFYLVRAQTSCGEGTVGTGLNAARTVPSCP